MKIQEVRSIEKITKVVRDVRKRIPKLKRKNPVNPPRDSTSFQDVLKKVLDKKK